MDSLNKTKQKGFTLVEVLVVAAIIALLASIIVTTLGLVRSKGRDARRVADIRQLNSAIQFYINDNGHAPYVGGTSGYNCNINNASSQCQYISQLDSTAWNLLGSDLAPYMQTLPRDPQSTSSYQYGYLPPSYENYYCTANCNGADNTDYAVFVSRTENPLSILNLMINGTLTFGFGSSGSYYLGD